MAAAGFASAAQAGGIVLGCDEVGQAFIATTTGIKRAGACTGPPWVVRLSFTSMSVSSTDPWIPRVRTILMTMTGPNPNPPKMSGAFKHRLDNAVGGQSVPIVTVSTNGLPSYVVTTYAAATPATTGGPR
jgi:hypothetical protein